MRPDDSKPYARDTLFSRKEGSVTMKHIAHVSWDKGESLDKPVMSDNDVLTWEAYFPNEAPTFHPAFASARITDNGWRIDYEARTNADAAKCGYDALSHLASWGIKGSIVVERVS